jgi:hypothetical protein
MSISLSPRLHIRKLTALDEWRRPRPAVSLPGQSRTQPPPEPQAKPRVRQELKHDEKDRSTEPEVLDGDCTAADLAFALAHLHFTRNGLCTLRLDRDVRDYLLTTLRPHARPHR